MHNEVGRRLLLLLSRILGLPDSYLWDNVADKGPVLPHSSYCRFQVYHPIPLEQRPTATRLLQGHTDFGTTTLLPSQPITCLQMVGADGEWRYVPYRKGALLCNLGDVTEILSGGVFKATRHRVVKPVADQADYERISIVSFNHADQQLSLQPLLGECLERSERMVLKVDAPLLQKLGVRKESQVYGAFARAIEEGEQLPKFGEWKTLRNKMAERVPDKIVMIDGKAHSEHIIGSVKVYREV